MANKNHDHIIDALVNHVTLPPRLPFRDDLKGGDIERALVQRLARHARAFRDSLDAQHYKSWSLICHALDQFMKLHSSNSSYLNKETLEHAFIELSNSNSANDILILHIATQNAGLIIRKEKTNEYIFEAFEASPRAADVLASKSALQWDFPSRAVAISQETFEDPDFQQHIARFLEQASIENVKDFSATTLKAGSNAFESRDTANPALIGQLLMALLEANGRAHVSTITRKRVRDDVCWGDGAENPWRRCPAWLVLRIGMQRSLCLLLGGDAGVLHYKIFIAYFIAKLCDEMSDAEPIRAEYLAHARAKVARRLAKLKILRQTAPLGLSKNMDEILSKFDKELAKTLQVVNEKLAAAWADIRRWSQKRIPRLPTRAEDDSLVISLANSCEHLQQLCRQSLPYQQSQQNLNRASYLDTYSTVTNGIFDVGHYLGLAEVESEVEAGMWAPSSQPATDEQCIHLVNKIHEYQETALSAYNLNPEQLSLMILTIMELWTSLDLMALQLYPLLSEYETGIPTEILHVLQLSRFSDLRRLRTVEDHLRCRYRSANHSLPFAFGDPSKTCFAVRYFDQSETMKRLLKRITTDGEGARELKEMEWESKSAQYEGLLKKAAEQTCLYTLKENRLGETYRVHNRRHCEKCSLEGAAANIRIAVDEYPLPENENTAKAAVFELLCPRVFAAWRDSTWNILSKLGREPSLATGSLPPLILDYSGLRDYGSREPRTITLASTTKSFLKTHYRLVPFPVLLAKVCLPNGLRLGLYDQQQKIWTARQTTLPSFARHCTSSLPPKSIFSSLGSILRAASDNAGRSANEIVASQMDCPSVLTQFEYVGFQELVLGTKLRWVQLLRELASPSINFGTPATVALVSQLALQAGGYWEDSTLRISHWVFRDDHFCFAFLRQIRMRLEAIKTNWRESQTLECLITLTQQVWELGASTDATDQASSVLKDIRATTLAWTRSLRQEILNAKDGKIAQMRSRNALFAAFLFRRTYVLEINDQSDKLSPETLADFIECSMILYDNMPEDGSGRIAKLPLSLRNMFVRDLKGVHRLRIKLCQSVLSMGTAVDCAMNRIWPAAAEAPQRAFTAWEFLPSPYEQWISAQSVAIDGMRSQEFNYNIIDGSLLIDRQKLSRLPEEYTKGGFFQQLLGERLYFTRPSPMAGMKYVLAALVEGNQVHFGVRGESTFMRAVYGFQTLELIPPGVFHGQFSTENPDLPMALINHHFHWLDLGSGTLTIRPEASMWRQKYRDWNIDIWNGYGSRRTSRLVDVRSSIFQRIANIFEPFELRSRMIVYQPEKWGLSVQLPNLEMSFFVNRQGLLQSGELRAVIDDDQDAGTLYGLDSKLILRSVSNPRERSIIVAMGPTEIRRYLGHVRAFSNHSGFYCRFSINTILNRLECPPEPRVVYMKAYCHAITSFVLPDPLTGKTGTEEALYSLSCGTAQPWAPVDEEAYRWLSRIGALSPKRAYYPHSLKVQQRVLWLENLAYPAQDERLYPAVAQILAQCRQLYRFNPGAGEPPSDDSRGDNHLIQRATVRNNVYRCSSSSRNMARSSDMLYLARDQISSVKRADAFKTAKIIREWSPNIHVAADLAGILEHWPLIQGYQENDPFQPYLLDELINLNAALRWGSLFNYCQKLSREQNMYGAMFFFTIIAFGGKVDMTIVRTLMAFTIVKDFQSLSIPKWDNFTHFSTNTTPTANYLVQLMGPAVIPYPPDERSLLGEISLNYKQQRALEAAQTQYEQSAKDIRQTLAKEMLRNWPCETPSVQLTIECHSVDLERAVMLVRPEWLQFFKNYELWRHLMDVQQILNTCDPTTNIRSPETGMTNKKLYPVLAVARSIPTMQDVIDNAEALLKMHPVGRKLKIIPSAELTSQDLGRSLISQANTGTDDAPILSTVKTTSLNETDKLHSQLQELQEIVSPLLHSENSVRRVYGEHLAHSLLALTNLDARKPPPQISIDRKRLATTLSSCQDEVYTHFDMICTTLNQHPAFAWLSRGGLWPNLTPSTLLETLGSNSNVKSFGILKEAIIAYARQLTRWQRLLRIEAADRNHNNAQLWELFDNEGHCEWNPKDYPDWLLLEIENSILIRTDQCIVAKAMITPESGSNSVLQMNMGQGKSSVIIPMIAAMLADRKQLFRVIVPKPLLLQMAQLLQARLGGLLGRTVKHVPFSRRTSTSKDSITAYLDLHRETLKEQGVILALPEHLLSFKLSGLQRLSSGKIDEAAFMMQVQSWLVSKFRDVLDECDYSLAVKTQLVYPSGAQSMIDGHPHRWKVVQAILRLVKGTVEQLQREYSRGIEITISGGTGRFPAIHFSQDLIKETLIERITESVCRGEGGILPINDCTKEELKAVANLLDKPRFSKDEILSVSNLFKNRPAARQDVLLLRGLLVYRILLMALNKRWNVQYGLHPNRDPVAVPYQAKGVPSDQAEFGHPDVAILLTCLSFYYSGLEEIQFEKTLRHVLKSDDPALDYDRWVQEAKTLPDSVRTWAAINVDDEIQRKELWDHLRYNMIVIDCFLNNFVFPYHAKTFERKLVSSAWDIPLPPSNMSAVSNNHSNARLPLVEKSLIKSSTSMTTGFSGTNDNRTLLPLNIEQRDLAGLAHTNAEVLTYLLQPRNRFYVLAADNQGRRLTEYMFLHLVFKHSIRMILDAGAQILELDNQDLVKTWLTVDTKAEAAVFFDKEDKARVLFRDGRSQPLVGSHFNDNLEACLVYLDEAHTRGTDLKMPATAVAALTLGPGQTKDHTVQGKPIFSTSFLTSILHTHLQADTPGQLLDQW